MEPLTKEYDDNNNHEKARFPEGENARLLLDLAKCLQPGGGLWGSWRAPTRAQPGPDAVAVGTPEASANGLGS